MVELNFRTKRNGVPILSKREIEDLAEIVLIDYDKDIVYNPKPSALDIDEIVECYAGLEMDYQDLTHDQSILGMTVFKSRCMMQKRESQKRYRWTRGQC